MSIVVFLVLLTLAFIISNVGSETISNIFHMKWRVCDIKMMSWLYVNIISDVIIGSSLYGCIFFITSNAENLKGKVVYALLGMSVYILKCIFFNIKHYDTVKKSLEILNITSNDELEEFIKQQEEI